MAQLYEETIEEHYERVALWEQWEQLEGNYHKLCEIGRELLQNPITYSEDEVSEYIRSMSKQLKENPRDAIIDLISRTVKLGRSRIK